METQNFNKITGWSSILSALLFITSIVGMQFYLLGDLSDVSGFLQNMTDNMGMMYLYGWPGFLATILMIPLFYWVHNNNKSNQLLSKSFLIMSAFGIGFVLIAYLFQLTFAYFHAPIYSGLSPDQQLAFDPVFKTTVGIQDLFWLGGDLLAFLGIACLALVTLREKNIKKWLIIMVAVGGVSAAIGSFNFLPVFKPNPVLEAMFMGGFLVFALWEIIFGIKLLKRPS